MAGVRTASVQVVATATIAAFVGAGGLGRFIIDGRAIFDNTEIFAGACSSPCSPWPLRSRWGSPNVRSRHGGCAPSWSQRERPRWRQHPSPTERSACDHETGTGAPGHRCRRPAAGNSVWKRQLEQQREQRGIVLRCWGRRSNVHVRAARRWRPASPRVRSRRATSTSACCSRVTARSPRTAGSRSTMTRSCSRSTTSFPPSTRPRPRQQVTAVLDAVNKKLTKEEVQKAVASVSIDGENPEDVAAEVPDRQQPAAVRHDGHRDVRRRQCQLRRVRVRRAALRASPAEGRRDRVVQDGLRRP